MKRESSWWWPIAAYVVAVLWLVVVNVKNLSPAFQPDGEHYTFLVQLDSTVHFMTALALSSVGASVLGRRRTLGIMIAIILLWELFEWVYQPMLARAPVTSYLWYYSDTMDDIAMGIAGTLTGVFFGTEALNGSEA